MSESINSLDSSLFCPTTMYFMEQTKAFAKEVMSDIIPGKLFVEAIQGLISYINPSLLVDDDLNDPGSEDFLVTADNKAAIANRIIEARITFDKAMPHETQLAYKQTLQTTFIKMLSDRMDKIDTLAKQMGIARPVQYAISLPSTPCTCPYRSIGDKFSWHDPVINAIVSELRVTAAPATKSQLSASEQQARQEFILAHEMAHIRQGDILVRIAAIFTMGILNIGLWATVPGMSASLLAKVIAITGNCALVQSLARLAYTALIRYQEKCADFVAMNTLGSSEGAQIFFSAYIDNPHDLEHPASSTRLAYARTWVPTQ